MCLPERSEGSPRPKLPPLSLSLRGNPSPLTCPPGLTCVDQDPFLFSSCRKEKWFLHSKEKRTQEERGALGVRSGRRLRLSIGGTPAFRSLASKPVSFSNGKEMGLEYTQVGYGGQVMGEADFHLAGNGMCGKVFIPPSEAPGEKTAAAARQPLRQSLVLCSVSVSSCRRCRPCRSHIRPSKRRTVAAAPSACR